MSYQIVTVNVTQQIAPTPSTLQGTGVFVSQGATTLTPSSFGPAGLLTQLSSLTPLLTGAKPNSTLSWSGSVVTVTTTSPHGFTMSDTLPLTISGVTPSGYNGTFTCTVTGTSTFTYPLASNPGAETIPGVYTPEDVAELVSMATTFFAQGTSVGVYVLELGPGNATDGSTTLGTWIAANPQTVYSFLVPREWDGNAGFLALIALYEATTSMTYFWVTTTSGTYTDYTSGLMKNVNALIESPSKPSTEFSQAAQFWKSLSYQPSSTNKVAPFSYSYLSGVTPYPTAGNSSLLTTWQTAGVSVILTGAEGGISNTLNAWGYMMDLNPFNYWYSVDYAQINVNLNISNAVINGSNNPLNPLYLNQQGITVLEGVGAATLTTMITVGLALGQVNQVALTGPAWAAALAAGTYAGQCVINAVPFEAYYTINPGDYKQGKYNGFSVCYTPLRGFSSITFDIVVTSFVAV